MDRREFLKTAAMAAAAAALPAGLIGAANAAQGTAKPKVYFTKTLTPQSLRKMYALVHGTLGGKIAIKLHTGEPHGPNIIPPAWVRELMGDIPGGSVVETNTYYGSPRATTAGHRETLKINGWADFTTVDIMDEDGEVNLPVPGGKWFKTMAMGKNLVNYDSMLVLTHFKGHLMGGFGGSIKNIAIGCASAKGGKRQQHELNGSMWGASEERLMEHMAESAKATVSHFGGRMAFINVMRNMSVDCDCAGTSAAPVVTPDIGILASHDILAIDQACVDLVYALPAKDKKDLVERIESRKGLRQLSYGAEIGLGSREYELVTVD